MGRPEVRLIHRECADCGQADPPDSLKELIPPGGNYAFDLIVWVGLARFRDHRQDGEIQADVFARWGLSLPASAVGLIADSFLDGLTAVNRAHAEPIRRRLAADGGYALHVDGTCEANTDVLFAAIADPRGWTLEAGKMTTENAAEIRELMQCVVERFGEPLALVRDLSPNIEQAKQEAIPHARDLICHFHFLENVGKRLCEKPHAQLETGLRRLKVRPALTSLRKDLVRYSRKGEPFSRQQIEHVLAHPAEMSELDPVRLRRLLAYLLLRWLDDYSADLQGEYFPFDLPSLAFYRRGLTLQSLLDKLVKRPDFPQHQLSTLKTMARHLAKLREDKTVVRAAARLEKAATLFRKLRRALRLSCRPDERLLRGGCFSDDRRVTEQMPDRLNAWREKLQTRHDCETDQDRRADQAIVLNYLQKYETQLTGHVINLSDDREPFVVQRTNNPVEHLFGTTKRGVRRKLGVKQLSRHLQSLRAECLLVRNLTDAEYLAVVLEGSIDNLPTAMAKHWSLSQAIRQHRLASTTGHPMPTTKKQLRTPELLSSIEQTICQIVETIDNAA